MKRFNLLVAVFAMIAFAGLSAAPKLEIEGGTTYDWGRVKPENSPLKAKIKLWNKGDELLEIKRVKPGCGCTTTNPDTNMVAPGKYATMEVSLNISSYNGPVTKSISIFTNDSANDHTVLFIKADISRAISTFPTNMAFSRLFVGEEGNSKVVLTNNTEKPIKIVKVVSTNENVKLNLKEGDFIKPKEPFSLEAKITPKEVGRLNFEIQIETDNDEMRAVSINGWGNIVDKAAAAVQPTNAPQTPAITTEPKKGISK